MGAEDLWRVIAAGACLGLPAYVVGTITYSGRRIPGVLLAITGCASGGASVIVVSSALAPPWAPAVMLSIVGAVTGAAVFMIGPEAQAKLRQHLLGGKGSDRSQPGPR